MSSLVSITRCQNTPANAPHNIPLHVLRTSYGPPALWYSSRWVANHTVTDATHSNDASWTVLLKWCPFGFTTQTFQTHTVAFVFVRMQVALQRRFIWKKAQPGACRFNEPAVVNLFRRTSHELHPKQTTKLTQVCITTVQMFGVRFLFNVLEVLMLTKPVFM